MQSSSTASDQNQLRIQLQHQGSKINLINTKQQLTYIILSTEPGRNIIYPPIINQNSVQFQIKKCQGISQQSQSYCAVGLSNFMKQIRQLVIKKPNKTITQKVLYISKINLAFKPFSNTYFLDKKQQYNFSLNTMPPLEITATQIQQFLESIIIDYGNIQKIDVQRNCLMLNFQTDITIKKHFIVKGIKTDQNGNYILTYWAFTTHRTLYTYQPIKLIQLPRKEHIKDYIIQSEWLILTTQQQVLFLHLYRPSINFLSLNQFKTQAICPMENDKVVIFQYKFMHIYQLFTYKNPHFIGKCKIKKIQPYTVAFHKKVALFGGINYSSILNQPTKQKEIYVIQNFTTNNISYKHFLADKKLQICKKSQQTPLKNLKYLPKQDLFLCSCAQSIYLIHLDSSSMIASVDLTSTVRKLYQIQYPINIVNCLVSAKNQKNLIRIGFEQYGQIVGAQVNSIDKFQNVIDFVVKGKQIIWTDGDNILSCCQQKSKVIYSCQEKQEKIIKISMIGDLLAFLLLKKSVIESYFMELL